MELPNGTPAGSKAMKEANTMLSDGYKEVTPTIGLSVDEQLAKSLSALNPNKSRSITKEINRSNSFQQLDEKLKNSLDNPLTANKEQVQSLKEVLKNAAQRQDATDRLINLDRAFAKQRVNEGAAINVDAADRIFNPKQYLSSVKSNSSKRSFGQGTAHDQQLAEDAVSVISPDGSISGIPSMPYLSNVFDEALAFAGAPFYSEPIQKATNKLIGTMNTGTVVPSALNLSINKFLTSKKVENQKDKAMGSILIPSH